MALCKLFQSYRKTLSSAFRVSLILALVLVLSCVGSANTLANAEVCNGIYGYWDQASFQQASDFPLTILTFPSQATIADAHRLGTRVLTYYSFYHSPSGWEHQMLDLAQHPDFTCIHPDGTEGLSIFDYPGQPKWKTMCQNSPGLRAHVLNMVKMLMDWGADGVFIDNAHPDVVCAGPQYGRHTHIYPDQDNTYAFRQLLIEIRTLVKSYGEDKLVVVNPGDPKDEWVGACDGQMAESYIYSWAWNNRYTDAKILQMQQKFSAWADNGTPIIALSYLGYTNNPVRDDAFFAYSWAKLSGFIWADWFTGKSTASELYRLRLGKPTGPMQTLNGCYVREYADGVVATASQTKGGSFRIDANEHPVVTDVYNRKLLRASRSGYYEITLKAGQGRVYTFSGEVKIAKNHRSKTSRSVAPAHRGILAYN